MAPLASQVSSAGVLGFLLGSSPKKIVSSGRAGAGAVVVSCQQDCVGQSDVDVNSSEVSVAVGANETSEQHDCVGTELRLLALCDLMSDDLLVFLWL